MLILLGVLAPRAWAAPANFVVYESTLNKLAGTVGSVKGNAGRYDVKVKLPCFPDSWNVCTSTIYSEELLWTLSNARFTITPNGISFSARLDANYGIFNFSSTVSGPVRVSYDAGTAQFKISITSVSVPINIDGFTLTTLNVDPHFNFSFPIGSTAFQVQTTDGGVKTLHGQPSNITLNFLNGAVRIDTELVLW